MKKKNTTERGKFKEYIQTALYKSENVKSIILDNTDGMTPSQIREEFKNHVKSHLFIDDTMERTGSFIFYDVRMPSLRENIKKCEVVMYVISHEDTLDNYHNEQFPGNRADALSQMVEDCLINDEETAREFGIGDIELTNVDIYVSKRFYGCIMRFVAYNFR